MDTVIETILTNAGFAGALLTIAGYALWKKDLQVKSLQESAVTREREHAERIGMLAGEYTGKLGIIADARTSDAQHVARELMDLQEKDASATMEINTTLTELKGVLVEIRTDVRRRQGGE